MASRFLIKLSMFERMIQTLKRRLAVMRIDKTI